MEQVLMMMMQLCEAFAERSDRYALTEDEAMTYNQCLVTTKKHAKLLELHLEGQIEDEEEKRRRPPEQGMEVSNN